ncbi:hypothetical protein D1AOALGA4SA_11601 [Olavius algarvensis Delta 1 endosymbiont]|nr:hypothetical protein D1AOALGA4SA_11601 [Olavius algarvensis Delta 1 endosymbiont]
MNHQAGTQKLEGNNNYWILNKTAGNWKKSDSQVREMRNETWGVLVAEKSPQVRIRQRESSKFVSDHVHYLSVLGQVIIRSGRGGIWQESIPMGRIEYIIKSYNVVKKLHVF